jgi:hypothetical protein
VRTTVRNLSREGEAPHGRSGQEGPDPRTAEPADAHRRHARSGGEGLLPQLGKIGNATSEKATRALGWAPRSNEEAIVATAESLLWLTA